MKLSTRALVVAPAVLAVTLAVGGGPASADDHANCVGEFASTLTQFGQTWVFQGLGGGLVSEAALP